MIDSLIGTLPFFGLLLFLIFLIVIGRSSLRAPRRKKSWVSDDVSDHPIVSPALIPPPEEPLSIFPREEIHNPAPEPDFQLLGTDSDTHHESFDFGSGGVLDGGVSDTSSSFDSSSFDSSGFGGGGDFGGGGAGGDWGSSGSDSNN